MSLLPAYIMNFIKYGFNVLVGKFCEGVCQIKLVVKGQYRKEKLSSALLHFRVYTGGQSHILYMASIHI